MSHFQFFKSRVPPLTKNAGPGVPPGTKKKSNSIFVKSKDDRLPRCEKNFQPVSGALIILANKKSSFRGLKHPKKCIFGHELPPLIPSSVYHEK